jgi:hypothetical protein
LGDEARVEEEAEVEESSDVCWSSMAAKEVLVGWDGGAGRGPLGFRVEVGRAADLGGDDGMIKEEATGGRREGGR